MLKRLALTCLGVLAIAGTAFAQGGSHGNYDPLTLTCVSAGNNYVEIGVKAGASGAPAGFTLQWMSLADWEANGEQWYASDDPRLCKMSFSGQPSFSGNNATVRWELAAYGDVTIRIGDQLYDETGVSGALADDGTGHFTSPDCALACGTEYVFRAFAHASRFNGRSCFSFIGTAPGNETGQPFNCSVSSGGPEVVEPGSSCSTATDCNGCTYTQGFWKTHGAGACHNGNNADNWCVSSLQLGSVTYTKDQLCGILNTPAKGNGLLALAHQLIAAKLNSACTGATCDDAVDIAAADAFIGSKVIPPVGSASVKAKDLPSGLITALDDFNNGNGCAKHCSNPGLSPADGAAGTSKKMRWGSLKKIYR